MLNAETIDKEILELEQHDTTFATCEKLAWLYIVKDHLSNVPKSVNASGSEFLDAINGVDEDELYKILDEHITAIKVIHPKEYTALMNRIKAL